MSKKIGFMVLGVGNGHITQSEIIYNILKNNGYEIPVIIIYSSSESVDHPFVNVTSDIIYKKIHTNYNTPHKYNNESLKQILIDLLLVKTYIKDFEEQYKLNLWISFFAPVVDTTIPSLFISNQICIDGSLPILISTVWFNQIFVSIGEPNKISDNWVPPLINLSLIERKINKENKKSNKRSKVCLVYKVSGNEFIYTLNTIVDKNIDFIFHLFCDEKPENLNNNITWHPCSRVEFKKYLSLCNCVLSTAGDGLVNECVYNEIPIAIMPSSKKHVEQIHNKKKYCDNYKYALHMDDNLNLNKLSERSMNTYKKHLNTILNNRDKKVLQLVKQFSLS